MAVIGWILTVLTLGYFLPWAIAATRGKSNAGMIGWLNLLLGWTLIGWIVSLVMACTSHQVASPASNVVMLNYAPNDREQTAWGPVGPPGLAPRPAATPPVLSWPSQPAQGGWPPAAAAEPATERWQQRS